MNSIVNLALIPFIIGPIIIPSCGTERPEHSEPTTKPSIEATQSPSAKLKSGFYAMRKSGFFYQTVKPQAQFMKFYQNANKK
jgi:hypothetical protein